MSLDLFWEAVQTLDGIGSKRHAEMLHGLIRWLQPESVVEVGSWRGYTAAWMAFGLAENGQGRLFCIDDFSLPGGDEERLRGNLDRCGLLDRVTIVNARSQNPAAWPHRVDMAFIDGDHSYEGCKGDVNRAIERGAWCVCVHDTVGWWGPRDWLDELRGNRDWDVIEGLFDSGMAVCLKRLPKPPVEYSKEDWPTGAITYVE